MPRLMSGEETKPHLLSYRSVVNPQRACAARVTVLGLCVCVCVSVCLRLFSHYRQRSGIRAIPTAPVQQALKKLDSTKVQTLGAISESIMRQDTHCTAASYIIRWDTGPRSVYMSTEPVSRRLAASAGKLDCTSAFPRCAGQLVAKGKVKEASSGQRYIRGVGSIRDEKNRAGRGPWYVHACSRC